MGLKSGQEQKGSPGYEHSQATPLYSSMASLSPTMASGALLTYAMPVLYLRVPAMQNYLSVFLIDSET